MAFTLDWAVVVTSWLMAVELARRQTLPQRPEDTKLPCIFDVT